LRALETGVYVVRVEELTLRPAGVNDGDLERGQLMAAGFVVTGYRLGGPAVADAVSYAGAVPEGGQ